ncbi:MAG TPA: Hsp20/alpha crystallin family protein [Solirubrobacteraceae bacterium]|nr:Hsp20/alpha crystallin family protein [Solirubrobacteraceae bacterium]
MALVRWEPARDFPTLQSEMNRLFSSFFDPASGGSAVPRFVPAMDLVETDDAFVLKADLPGVPEQDVHVEVEGDVLTISGERKSEHREEKAGQVRIERAYGSFRRAVTLPEGVDAAQVKASFDKGVLEVRIPKPAERKPHKVQIAVGNAPADIEGEAGKTS